MTLGTDIATPTAAQSIAAPCVWLPVYIEPIAGSGERITVAIAARTVRGRFHVQRTLDAHVARCMYGPFADNINGFVELITASLTAHLETGALLNDWRPPLAEGVFVGPLSDGYDDNAAVIADAGAALTSSIAARHATLADNADSLAVQRGDEWIHEIRGAVVARRPAWTARFDQPVALGEGAPATRIGYLGPRLAAQFGRLVPGRSLAQSRRSAKAYATDLQLLRDREVREALLQRPYYELLLWLPDANNLAFSQAERDEAVAAHAELEAFGDTRDLRVIALHDSDAAAQRIVKAEEPA